jgi:low affinity Fe/Cu permease
MNKPVLPDPQKIQKTVVNLQEVCHQFDALNFKLDELIAQVDVEIRNSPLTLYHLKKRHETKSA